VFEQTVSDENLKKQLNRLFESISSSPFHTEAGVEEIESRLVETIDDLKDAVEDHDYPLVEKLTEDALKVVKERNNYLKLNH
jgi:Txe/YoeB family toxin of Txe-Axe toxin-antitoxin module